MASGHDRHYPARTLPSPKCLRANAHPHSDNDWHAVQYPHPGPDLSWVNNYTNSNRDTCPNQHAVSVEYRDPPANCYPVAGHHFANPAI